ncbi:MAG: polysaccharide deacetylase family protein [Cytophagaceae bacterium]|nr:polysaccharide deacetylase family protein [Cytophagaceae bacterium]
MYFNNAGWFLTTLYPTLIWRKKVEEKIIYLTFDDGPIPEITEYVLEELEKFKVKATFFCVGDNIRKYPDVFKKILPYGHAIGNHTFNHLNGWKTDDDAYIDNVQRCETIMSEIRAELIHNSQFKIHNLFRPPYGLIKKSQIKRLPGYQIIMWDVLTGDFNKDLSAEKCLHKSIKYTKKGSIVIFHDSIKAEKNLRYALPRFLDHFISQGYRFETL